RRRQFPLLFELRWQGYGRTLEETDAVPSLRRYDRVRSFLIQRVFVAGKRHRVANNDLGTLRDRAWAPPKRMNGGREVARGRGKMMLRLARGACVFSSRGCSRYAFPARGVSEAERRPRSRLGLVCCRFTHGDIDLAKWTPANRGLPK